MYKIIDDCTRNRAVIFESNCFEHLEQAKKHADHEWDRLSDHDKKIRDAFYVVNVEDGEAVYVIK